MQYIVLCVKGCRVASYPMSAHNLELTRKLFRPRLIQRDANGTEYHEVTRAPSDLEAKGLELDPPNVKAK